MRRWKVERTIGVIVLAVLSVQYSSVHERIKWMMLQLAMASDQVQPASEISSHRKERAIDDIKLPLNNANSNQHHHGRNWTTTTSKNNSNTTRIITSKTRKRPLLVVRTSATETVSNSTFAGAIVASKTKKNITKLIDTYNRIIDNITSSFVQSTDSTLLNFHEGTTPIVFEGYKLVLIANPKVASTVLKQLMRRMMGYEDNYHVHKWNKVGLPHSWPANGLNYTSQYSLQKVNEMMTSNEWTRAMFVRDPKEHMLSAYLMFRSQVEVMAPDYIRRAKAGTLKSLRNFTQNVHAPAQLKNCCQKIAGEMDANWKVLCFNHTLTFEGFLDAIENGPTKFSTDTKMWERRRSRVRFGEKFTPEDLRKSPGGFDIHWSPLSLWRMEPKFYKSLNFVGHLETAQRDIRQLLDRLHPHAWETYGASGWGTHRNESIFTSKSTVNHASNTSGRLFQYYTSKGMERRVDKFYESDYENVYLNLTRVPVGEAEAFYKSRY